MQKTQKTVLIIDDEQLLLHALKLKLEKANFSIIEAENGEKGLQIAKEQKPDIILMDIVMPVMDGVEMLQELRKDNWGREVPVIALTNLTDQDKQDKLFTMGISDLLIKTDWKLDEVIDKVRKTIE